MTDFRVVPSLLAPAIARRTTVAAMDQFSSWPARHRIRVGFGAAVVLAILFSLNVISVLLPQWLPDDLVTQVDLTGTANIAAGFGALLGIMSGTIAGIGAVRSAGLDRIGWWLLAIGCAGITLMDWLFDHPDGRELLVAALLFSGMLIILLHRHLQDSRQGLALLLLVVIVGAVNPLLDRYEKLTYSDPNSYRFVSQDDPYQMTAAAWKRLALVQQTQEASETLALILLAQLFLLEMGGRAPEPTRREPVQEFDAVRR